MQDWPALMIRDRAETSAAFSRSASASTMEGSEPPSSSTAGLISLAAIEATREPARSEPVKDTAWIRGSRMTRSTSSVAACRRSEEHTSELQSRGHLVCRLLLERKKTGEKGHSVMIK